jgi:hypothetical protein
MGSTTRRMPNHSPPIPVSFQFMPQTGDKTRKPAGADPLGVCCCAGGVLCHCGGSKRGRSWCIRILRVAKSGSGQSGR